MQKTDEKPGMEKKGDPQASQSARLGNVKPLTDRIASAAKITTLAALMGCGGIVGEDQDVEGDTRDVSEDVSEPDVNDGDDARETTEAELDVAEDAGVDESDVELDADALEEDVAEATDETDESAEEVETGVSCTGLSNSPLATYTLPIDVYVPIGESGYKVRQRGPGTDGILLELGCGEGTEAVASITMPVDSTWDVDRTALGEGRLTIYLGTMMGDNAVITATVWGL